MHRDRYRSIIKPVDRITDIFDDRVINNTFVHRLSRHFILHSVQILRKIKNFSPNASRASLTSSHLVSLSCRSHAAHRLIPTNPIGIMEIYHALCFCQGNFYAPPASPCGSFTFLVFTRAGRDLSCTLTLGLINHTLRHLRITSRDLPVDGFITTSAPNARQRSLNAGYRDAPVPRPGSVHG